MFELNLSVKTIFLLTRCRHDLKIKFHVVLLEKTRRSSFSMKHNDYFEPYHNRLRCFPVALVSAEMFTFGLFFQTFDKQKPPSGTRVMASQLLPLF